MQRKRRKLPHNPLLDIYAKEMKTGVQTKTGKEMFIAALFTIMQNKLWIHFIHLW